jgi:hypothetical protein
VRSLYLLQRVDIGVNTANVINVELLSLPRGRVANDAHRSTDVGGYYRSLLDTIAAWPGVQSVGMSQAFPRQRLAPTTPVSFVGAPDGDILSSGDTVSPGFFETMKVPLIAGRFFTWLDAESGTRSCIVTESLARRLRPGGDVLRRRIRYGTVRDRQDMTIVGIVGNINLGNLRVEQPPIVFVPPVMSSTFSAPNLLIATMSSLDSTATAMRRLLAERGREYAREIAPVQRVFDRAPASERMTATLAVIIGVLALILAMVGIHGALAYSVARRTREIGVRVAIGANPAAVARSIIREAAALTMIGVSIGVPTAFVAGRALRSLLYGVTEADLISFAAAAAIVSIVGVFAGVLPARRAAAVDPVLALRE